MLTCWKRVTVLVLYLCFSCRWGTFIHLVAITELPNPFRRKNNATDYVGMINTHKDDEHEMTNAETLKQIESLQRFGLFNIILVQLVHYLLLYEMCIRLMLNTLL